MKNKELFPIHSEELSTENRVRRASGETAEDVMQRLYSERGQQMKITKGNRRWRTARLTTIASNRLTVYVAVERILAQMGQIPRRTVELRLDYMPWGEVCRIVGKSRPQAWRYWRQFLDEAMPIVFDETSDRIDIARKVDYNR